MNADRRDRYGARMTRVRLTLTLDRATLAKAGDAEQAGLFGDLVPEQKIVRRKSGKTHVQTFHTRPESHLSVPKPRPQSLEEAARAGRKLTNPRSNEERDLWREQDRRNSERPVTRAEFEPLKPRASAEPEKPSITTITGTRPDGSPWMPEPTNDPATGATAKPTTFTTSIEGRGGIHSGAKVPLGADGRVDVQGLQATMLALRLLSPGDGDIRLVPVPKRPGAPGSWASPRGHETDYDIFTSRDPNYRLGGLRLPNAIAPTNPTDPAERLVDLKMHAHDAHEAAMRADDEFRAALERVYGKKEAREARYLLKHDDPEVQALANAKVAADRAFHEAAEAIRAHEREHPTAAKAVGLENLARDLFAKAIRPNLTPKKITRKDSVTQTYHTGTKKQPSVRTPGAAQPAGTGRQPAAPKPQSVPTRVTGAAKRATAPQPAPGGQQQPSVKPALATATPTGPARGQRPDGLPPKATGASVERAASRASRPTTDTSPAPSRADSRATRPKPITSDAIPPPPSYDPDMDVLRDVFKHEGEEGLLKAAITHVTRMLDTHRQYLDTVRDRFDAHIVEGQAVVNMGLPASGKTSAAKKHALRHGQYLHVDVDALKAMHPEYDPKDPGAVHGFSKKVEAAFFERAKELRLPLVLDTTGGNWKRWGERIKLLRAAGYHHVSLAYAKVEVEESRRRNAMRDRTVPEEVIEGTLAEFDPNHPGNEGKTPFQHLSALVDKTHIYDHRHESDRHGMTEFGKQHSAAARKAAWADYVASERRVRAAAGMGKAVMASLASIFHALPRRPVRYNALGGPR